ncbi:hypothetical protein CVT25_002190 [Psilocybe cyanescens]|uniref:Uncharacterized protein n=1 Tax=Psilocybe cyanescens TaxID=93625 RepID=A0A409XF97_PSICY|nr:hypothetical protein CVT25_002190 [Psilocybe cyanescens]
MARGTSKAPTPGSKKAPAVESATIAIARAIVQVHVDRHSNKSEAEKLRLQETFLDTPEMKKCMEQINTELIRLVRDHDEIPKTTVATLSHRDGAPNKSAIQQLKQDGNARPRDFPRARSELYKRWLPKNKEEDGDDTASLIENGLPEWITAFTGSGSDQDSERLNEIFEEFKGQLLNMDRN